MSYKKVSNKKKEDFRKNPDVIDTSMGKKISKNEKGGDARK